MPPVVFSIEKGCLSVGFATEREVYNTAHTHFQTAIRKGRHSGRVTSKKKKSLREIAVRDFTDM